MRFWRAKNAPFSVFGFIILTEIPYCNRVVRFFTKMLVEIRRDTQLQFIKKINILVAYLSWENTQNFQKWKNGKSEKNGKMEKMESCFLEVYRFLARVLRSQKRKKCVFCLLFSLVKLKKVHFFSKYQYIDPPPLEGGGPPNFGLVSPKSSMWAQKSEKKLADVN